MAQAKGLSKKRVRYLYSPSYAQALEAYWAGDSELCKAKIFDGVKNEAIDDSKLALYRLWIAILADENDTVGLEALSRHFQELAVTHKNFSSLFYSLMSVCHFEADQVEASKVWVKTLVGAKVSNVYLEEIKLRLALRMRESVPEKAINSIVAETFDYVQLELLGGFIFYFKLKQASRSIQSKVDKYYPVSPFSERVELYQAMAQGKWRVAARLAQSLYTRYPNDRDYVVAYAATNWVNKRYKNNFAIVERRTDSLNDPEIMALIGASWLANFKVSGSTKELEIAEASLKQSANKSSYASQLSGFVNKNLTEISSMSVSNESNAPSNWLVKVSSKSFYELRRKKQGLKGIKKALGPQIKRGDICWIIFEDKYSEQGTWRLGAIMSAESDVEWHPTHRYQSSLKLDLLLEVAIPIELSEDAAKVSQEDYSKEDSRRYGVFELQESALEVIEQSLSFYQEVYEEYEKTVSPLRLAK